MTAKRTWTFTMNSSGRQSYIRDADPETVFDFALQAVPDELRDGLAACREAFISGNLEIALLMNGEG